MNPQVFGKEHIIYIIVSTILGALILLLIKEYARTPRQRSIAIKALAFLLFASIMANRLSQVFRYENVRWYCIIPDSFCGMTSLVISLGALFGKKNNCVYHFLWLLSLFGGIATVIYPTFVSQHPSFFYLPTFSGLLHHSFSAILTVALLMLGQIDITYKKWHYVVLGFTCYLSVGAFLMSVFGVSDAFHIVEPLFSDTPLTVWVMAPMYLASHGAIFALIELYRHKREKKRPITI
ncbi:MAG: hypothetical protein IJF11_00630 [Clostridia bacterium]|nr:hypothetical protein [Clostridia bacterium]